MPWQNANTVSKSPAMIRMIHYMVKVSVGIKNIGKGSGEAG
jgi:hypothetical protein